MTTLQIDLEEVHIRAGSKGFEITDALDLYGCGLMDFSVDVEIRAGGEWDITAVYAIVSKYAPGGGRQEITGEFGRIVARDLERVCQTVIDEKVKAEIMMSPRRDYPKAAVV